VIGCFLLAFITRAMPDRTWLGVPLVWTLGTGVMGGFTTYSSFNLELLQMMQRGEPFRAMAYATLTLLGCLLAGVLGLWCAGRLIVP
jgi:CrcB protein